jgi:hypothetical protein
LYNYYDEENITSLYPGEIFVFGSNLSGIHGAGAARVAMEKFDAVYGQGVGFTGDCYAIPTKDESIRTLPLERIKEYVEEFKKVAESDADLTYVVTKIGCGLAGYKNEEIAPLFKGASSNCWFHSDWREYLNEEEKEEA